MGLDIYVRKLTERPKRHYQCFRMIDDDLNYDNNGFPEWTRKFEKETTKRFYDWNKYEQRTGICLKDLDVLCETYDGNKATMRVRNRNTNQEFDIDLNKVPTKGVPIKVIYYNEVGYQRKGLNPKFYSDYREGKIGYFVWTKAELERYKDEYCDDTPYFEGRENAKDDFQHNIIDKFTEGEDCVIFDW